MGCCVFFLFFTLPQLFHADARLINLVASPKWTIPSKMGHACAPLRTLVLISQEFLVPGWQ